MKYIIFLTTVLFVFSCQTISSKTEPVAEKRIPDNSAIKTDNQKISSIRKIDFQNFTFPWTKTFGGKEKSFTLKNGVAEFSGERRLFLERLSFAPNEDQALLIIKIGDGNATYHMLYVYEIENKKPKLMESFEFGENNISFGTAFVAHGELIIETYHQLSGDAECCPSIMEISYYSWQKDKFVLQGEPHKIPNGYVERTKRKNEKN
jgi:hypothetical protein